MYEGQNTPIDGTAKVLVSNNGMEAFLIVYPPRNGGNPMSFDNAMRILREAGVVEGIKSEAVIEATAESNWGKQVRVAIGISAKDGEDGRIDYRFTLPQEKAKLVELEDGRVDYRNLNLITNVQQGELLAVRILPKLGSPGVSVTGKPMLPRMGKNIPLPRGKNTMTDDDGNYLYARACGHVSIIDGKVSVDQVYEIKGDVDYSSGNIDFVGNVHVRGNVTSGFEVKAGGDIQVDGIIEAARLEAAGDVLVKNGVAGGHKAVVRAGGSIYARFIENALIEAINSIIVSDAIVQSTIRAGEYIKVEGKKGTIVGGFLQASEEITAKVIGSNLSPQTVLEVGVNPQLREEYRTVFQLHQEKRRSFEALSQQIQVYQKSALSTDLPEKKKLAIIKLLEDYKVIKDELRHLEQRKDEIENELSRMQRGCVKVFDIIYPGVQIIIGQAIYTVNDPIKFAMFVLDQGDIRVGTYRT
ncbi:MAG: FapA family protein [Chitinophagales bacterium]